MLGQRSRLPALLAGLLLVWLARPATAADWPVPRGPSHEPAPYRYDAARWQSVPKSFLEDGPACTLHSCTSYLIEADGTIETIAHEITRFNGRKGIEKLGEYKNITYDPSYQKLTLNEARVLKADGRFVPLEPRHVQLRDLSTDYQVYDHDKQLILSFPNLEVGDAIEVKWTLRGKNPEYQGHFFTRYTFGDDEYPVVHDETYVRVPRGKNLKYAMTGGPLEPEVRDAKEGRLYHWQVKDRRPLPQDESLPSKEDLRLQLSCSTFPSWEAVGQWKTQLRSDCWECTADIRDRVRTLVKDLKTPEAKAQALAYWVRRNVRYVSVGEKHDYTPHAPATVFATRYGDCKDQSQLLAVMLREAGVPVALATLGVRDDGQVLEDVPSPWGTHAILLVTLDGKEHWVDTTVSLAGWDFLPLGDRDRLCYVVDDKGKLRLTRTPPLTPADNRTDQTTRVAVQGDGSSWCERTVSYQGSAALTQRDAWTEVPPGERRRLAAAELQDSVSRTRLLRLSVDEAALKDFNRPVTATLEFEIPNHFAGEGVREGSISDSKVWGKLLTYTLDYDRTAALDLWAPFELHHHYTIQLPPAYQFDTLPRNQTVRSPWGTFRMKGRANPDDLRRLDLDFETHLEKVRVEPADFNEFRAFHEELNKAYRVYLSIKPTDDPADAPALENWLAWAPMDAESATVLAGLYLDHGQRTDARRVLGRARVYQPNEPALWELTVKAAERLEDKEAAYREMARRFPEEPKYAVALGTTLVDWGKYAQARAVLTPISKRGPAATRGQAHYQLARCFLLEDRAARALEQVVAAGKADPESVRGLTALLFKAQVYEKLGRTADAIGAYQDALRVEGSATPETLAALIRLCLANNQAAEALDYLRRYTVAIGNDVEGLVTAAELHLRLGRYEDAFDLASRARDERFNQRSQAVLGLVYLHRGDWTRAAFHLERGDGEPAVIEGLLRCAVMRGELRVAEEQLPKAAKRESQSLPLARTVALVTALVQRRDALLKSAHVTRDEADVWRNALGHYVCANHAHETGRPLDEVEALLKPVGVEGVDYGPAHALQGILELERGRLSKALSEAERALVCDPKATGGYYVRGRVRLERGAEGALADLTRAAELSEHKDPAILHWLAAAQFQSGRRHEALATQREAVRLKPGDAALADQLKEFEAQAARP